MVTFSFFNEMSDIFSQIQINRQILGKKVLHEVELEMNNHEWGIFKLMILGIWY